MKTVIIKNPGFIDRKELRESFDRLMSEALLALLENEEFLEKLIKQEKRNRAKSVRKV